MSRGLLDMVLDGPVLSVEKGRPCLIGFVSHSPEASELLKVPGDFVVFFYIMVLFSWLLLNRWLNSAISDLKRKQRITRYQEEAAQLYRLSTISALEPCPIQPETNLWTPVISCHLQYLITLFYLDLA